VDLFFVTFKLDHNFRMKPDHLSLKLRRHLLNLDFMILVTLAAMAITSETNVSTLQTLDLIVPKFFAIHEDQSVEHPIYHYVA
jgi:hypothetical protein